MNNNKLLKSKLITNYSRWGKYDVLNFLDQTYTNSFLYGDSSSAGMLYRMRYFHPTIKKLMDSSKDSVQNLEWEFVPKQDLKSLQASILLKNIFESAPSYRSVGAWVADVWDRVQTYGHALYELAYDDEFNSLDLIPIEPSDIESFDLIDNYKLEKIRFKSGQEIAMNSGKVIWIGKKRTVNDWWGDSDLRSLADIYNAYLEDLVSYIGERRLVGGFVYMQMRDGELNDESRWRAESWCEAANNGEYYPLVLDRNLEIKTVKSDSGGITSSAFMTDVIKNQISDSLSHGISTMSSGGSYALGVEVSAEDRQRARKKIQSFEDVINGKGVCLKNAFATILQNFNRYNVPLVMVPELKVKENTSLRIEEKIELISEATKAGIFQPEDFKKIKNEISEEIGFTIDNEEEE